MSTGSATMSVVSTLAEAGEMIKFQHTVFALPFALISLITAAGTLWPTPAQWAWVLLAMVSARTAAMSFNRLADHNIDAKNPRTAERSLPAGRLSRSFVFGMVLVSVALFVTAAGMLNRLCLALAVPTLAVLLGYSYAKRFTPLVHVWLGFALGLAPLGAWVAVTGTIAWPPVILGAGVTLWVAGFDIIYALQDVTFDRDHGLFSLPARLGAGPSLVVARGLHLFAVAAFAAFAVVAGGGWLRLTAVGGAALLLIWQHWLVSPDDLSRVNAAFFTANGILAVAMGLAFVFAKMTDAA